MNTLSALARIQLSAPRAEPARPAPRGGSSKVAEPHSLERRWLWCALAGLIGLLSLLATPLANAQCSPYMGQVTINELRIGSSGNSNTSNQVELFNSGNVAPAVWSTWQLVIWSRSGGGTNTRRGGYFLSSGVIANGQFIYNNNKSIYLRNRTTRNLDVALVDANGLFIDYIALNGRIQTVPACLGTPRVVSASSSSNGVSGNLSRNPDGGPWPNTVTGTTLHTIGASNTCTASGNDLVVQLSKDAASAIIDTTTVTYTLTVTNKNCTNAINNVSVTTTAVSTANFNNLVRTQSEGTLSSAASSPMVWSGINLTAGETATLTFSGRARAVGTLVTTSSVSAPTSGLVNTSNDSDTASLVVSDFNYVGFEILTDSVTEGVDPSYSAVINARVVPNARITVNYTVSGTAGAGDTNLPVSGSVVIDPTDAETPSSTTIDFNITNDLIVEASKTIVLTITSVTSTDAAARLDTANRAMTITLLDNDTGVHHYELALPTSSINCLPSTVTVTACANATSPCTSPLTTAAGATATLATTGATLGATSVTFNGSGVATTTLSYPTAPNATAVSVALSGESITATNARQCCPNGTACANANSCSTTFNTAGFIVSGTAGGGVATLPTQTAGTASASYFLRAVQTNTTTGACTAALSGVNTVNWAYQCNNPITCSAGNLLSITGNSATAIAGNPNSGVTSDTSVPMTFDANGNAPFTFTFNDVGQVTLWARKTVNSATLTGSSNAFVTRPAGFTLTTIRQTASPNLANPAAANAAGTAFVRAGESFSATVTAVTSGNVATPNYGKESVAEGVLLTHALVQPAGGFPGTLANGSIAGSSFSGGAATVTNLAFSEVGIITLSPSVADASYLGVGNVSGTTSANIGRFIPARFALSGASVAHRSGASCSPASSFTYLGENFRLGFTLTAQNTGSVTTQNYTGAFAKFDPTVAGNFNLAGRDGTTQFSTGSARLSLGSATGAWSNGVASNIALTANTSRAAAPDGPFSTEFGIAPIESDGVAMASFDTASTFGGANDRTRVGTVALRFGRLRLSNAVGAQTQALALPLTAQFWTGATFDTNTLDSCTTVPATAISFGNLRRTLTAADTVASGISFAITTGTGAIRLAPPAGGRYGTVDLSLSLGTGSPPAEVSCLQPWARTQSATAGANLDFLRGPWCGNAYDKDPSARASFGLYRGSDSLIYQRENY